MHGGWGGGLKRVSGGGGLRETEEQVKTNVQWKKLNWACEKAKLSLREKAQPSQ